MLPDLVRRGLTTISQTPPKDDRHSAGEIMGKTLILGTVVVFIFASLLIRYVYAEVIATLAMVEDPSVTAYITVDGGSGDPDAPLSTSDKDGSVAEPELHIVRNRPITSSFRATLRHLRSRDGWTAPFRGAVMRMVYFISLAFVAGLMSWLPTPVATVIAVVLCSGLDLAWNNIIISERSPKYWFHRLPTSKAWFKVMPAATLYAVADQLSFLLPAQLAHITGLTKLVDNLERGPINEADMGVVIHAICRSALPVFIVGVAVAILVRIPAVVTLARVQASLLPDSEETIVPFDRTFDGKVVPEIIGGSGVIGMLDAWKSFGWSSRIRLLKVYAKIWAIEAALFALFMITLGVELFVFMPELVDAIVAHVNSGSNSVLQLSI